MRIRNAVIGGVATVATLSVIGIGIAEAAPTTPSSTPSGSSTSAAPNHQKRHKGDLLGRALHGQATVGGAKKQRVIDFQRGTVTTVGDGKLTVKSVDGFTATYTADAKTRVRKDKEKSAFADIRTGDRVRVIAVKDGSTLTLRSVGDRGPK